MPSPATIAVVMLVATCIGFNTARFPWFPRWRPLATSSSRLIIPVEDFEPPADQSTDDQPGDESTDDQPGDESSDYRSATSRATIGQAMNRKRAASRGRSVMRIGMTPAVSRNRSVASCRDRKPRRGERPYTERIEVGQSARPVVASMGMLPGRPRPRPAARRRPGR